MLTFSRSPVCPPLHMEALFVLLRRFLGSSQCDQIWPKCATFPKFEKSLEISGILVSIFRNVFHILANFVSYCENFKCGKWLNTEKLI